MIPIRLPSDEEIRRTYDQGPEAVIALLQTTFRRLSGRLQTLEDRLAGQNEPQQQPTALQRDGLNKNCEKRSGTPRRLSPTNCANPRTPTMGWVFQGFEGLDVLSIVQNGQVVFRKLVNLRPVQQQAILLLARPSCPKLLQVATLRCEMRDRLGRRGNIRRFFDFAILFLAKCYFNTIAPQSAGPR